MFIGYKIEKDKITRVFFIFLQEESHGMAVYSMVAYERVFSSHTDRVKYVMNYFCFNLAKVILLKLK